MRKEHQEVPSLAYRESGRVHRSCLAKLHHGPCDQRWLGVHRDCAVCKPRGSRDTMSQRAEGVAADMAICCCDTSSTRDVNMLETVERPITAQAVSVLVNRHKQPFLPHLDRTQHKDDRDSTTKFSSIGPPSRCINVRGIPRMIFPAAKLDLSATANVRRRSTKRLLFLARLLTVFWA
jgi:hypothetical protein